MNKIIWSNTSDETMTWDEANEWCEEQGGRLPKMWELAKAYDEKEEGFLDKTHWSSTEFFTDDAYFVHFLCGYTSINSKSRGSYVRCVLN